MSRSTTVIIDVTPYASDVYIDGEFMGGITRERVERGMDAVGEALRSIIQATVVTVEQKARA